MKNRIWQIVLVVSLILIVISGINVFRLSKEYRKGINEYKDLERFVTVESRSAEAAQPENKDEGAAEEITEVEEGTKIPVSIDVQFAQLKGINNDFVGWLYYEPLDISYPIVRGNDNEYYTHYTFENEQNSSGAIFMDFLNKKDYTDYNTIIYGHNMRNGTMFGSLKKLLNDQTTMEENPYFYVFTDQKAFMYEIFAAYVTPIDSMTYDLIDSEEKQAEFIDHIKENATYLTNKKVSVSDKIVTLSTCHGLHSNNRTVVHGVLIAEENR